MFKKNTQHSQTDIFGLFNSLPESMKKKIEKSEEKSFYKLIFSTINEELFAPLYADTKSRPNAPINAMVASLILMYRNTWTYEELFKNIQFNLLVRVALGLDSLEEMPFCQATLFNFQNRLTAHFAETGENLLEQVFDRLTEKQLKELKVKTSIQRTDSLAAASNIRNYTRLQLLVELLLRIWRVLTEEDKARFKEQFEPYVHKTSGQYIYSLQASDIPHELEKLARLYHWIDLNLKASYPTVDIFNTFERVYAEHFTVGEEKVEIKPPDRLSSSSVQSPDDLDAVYRNKGGKQIRGQGINVVETAHPENQVNLITDVAVYPLNRDDSAVLHERLEGIKHKTPEVEELHADGAYGSTDNDEKCAKQGVTLVQTGIRGPKPAVRMSIEHTSENLYAVSCPGQAVSSTPSGKKHKAVFDLSVCTDCALRDRCPSSTRKDHRVWYFTHEHYLALKRQQVIHTLPEERKRLRNNVEATVNEFVCKMYRNKLKVRGAFKASIFAFSIAMGVNFGRIHRL